MEIACDESIMPSSSKKPAGHMKMKIFERFRKKIEITVEPNVTDLAKAIGPLLDDLANNIFLAYRDILIAEPITYIVPAVWGVGKDPSLSNEQKAIHGRIAPVIQKVFNILKVDQLNEAQTFAIGYIVRSLIVSKITYMIEALKNKMIVMDVHEKKDYLLKDMEPLGHA